MPVAINARGLSRRALVLSGAAALSASRAKPATAAPPTPVDLELKDAYTFLVAGLDTRTVEGPENTDVIMVSRVELLNRRVRTISFPRDLLVEIPGHGQLKINAAYNLGSKANGHDWNAGAALFTETIEHNFGMEIDGVVMTDLKGLPGIVDALGGISVVNPYDLIDDAYPTSNYGTKEIYYPAGPLELTGEQALEFARTRHMDGDEGRVMRQHLVLAAMLKAAQQPERLANLPAIVKAGREYVSTNIPLEVQAQLVSAVPRIPVENLVWGTVIDFLWGENTADGGWNYMADWSYLPVHVRGWLGVGPKG
jgi:LCP family protein required for cell wall assembly